MSNYTGCMACSPNLNIIALRAAYLSAEAELEKWKDEVRHANARALAAERARDEAVAEVERLRSMPADPERVEQLQSIADGHATVALSALRRVGEAERERDEAVAALREVLADLEQGAIPNDLAFIRRALAASTGEAK